MVKRGTVKWFDIKKALDLFNKRTVAMCLLIIQISQRTVSKY